MDRNVQVLDVRTVELEGKKIKLQIWDTAGQERFRTITTAYYRGAMGIMLTYDVTDRASFDNLASWVKNVEQHAAEDVDKALLGNKTDMEDKRQVTKEEGEAKGEELGMPWMEVSAKTGSNVDDGFLMLAKMVKKRLIDSAKANAAGPAGSESGNSVKLAKGGEESAAEGIKNKCCA
ncbi:rab family protein [Sphaeroforma arctica JP610]|uniref:Rab family protein n=1 Tax=Sphaeroforma arctica JP610 TaxID=667725 RepID=A0A0L0GCQ0_9EUKA|nr:rab family protein [Sphaeroforma arctica JP610]KNC86661.1 rab family protein [Sphaeroforma arctica JP610]|eukprot:XP_014160563.1 rab family protein [Sphaeroforma arctica JP610]